MEMQGVVSKAVFSSGTAHWPKDLHGQCRFIKIIIFQEAQYQEKFLLTVLAIVQEEHVNFVAVDFNGTAWRLTSGNNLRRHLPTRIFPIPLPLH